MFYHKIYRSPFITNTRYKLFYWVSNLAIIPAFLLCFHIITDFIVNKFSKSEELPFLITTGTEIIILGLLTINSKWQGQDHNRPRLYTFSILSIFVLTTISLYYDNHDLLNLFAWLFGIVFLWALVGLLHILELKLLGLLIGLFSLTLLYIYPDMSSIISRASLPCIIYVIGFALFIADYYAWQPHTRFARLTSNRGIEKASQPAKRIGSLRTLDINKTRPAKQKEVILSVFFSLLLLLVLVVGVDNRVTMESITLRVAIVAVLILGTITKPESVIGRLRADVLSFLSPIRHDLIRRLVVSNLEPNNLLNRISTQFQRFIRTNSSWLVLLGLVSMGGVGVPILLVLGTGTDFSTSEGTGIKTLMTIGISTSSIFSFLFICIWLIINRQKHIVIPFKPTEANVQLVADMATHAFVEQLRSIAVLLSLRQVETLNDYSNILDSLFVTSGQQVQLVEQIRSLTSLTNDSNTALTSYFGQLITAIVSRFAQTLVTGQVQRRQDSGFEVWIQMTQQNGHTVAVDTLNIPGNTISEIDEAVLQEAAKTAAIKLLLKLGLADATTSSWRSLRKFLNGLDASFNRKWWQAVANYRSAIHLEQIDHNDSGIGHYHLGAALIFQGDLENGLKQLQLAESYGPPLAEIQYMLGLVSFYRYWTELDINEIAFEAIIKQGETAIKLRTKFPEAYHLLGATFYQRGKLCERAMTSGYHSKSQYSDFQQNYDYEHMYRQATHYLKTAIKHYKHILRQAMRGMNAEGLMRTRHLNVVRNYGIAVHQLADAQRSLKMYSTADALYHDVAIAFPGNIRNFVDQARTNCLAKNWQSVDEFLRRDVLRRPEARWNAEVNFFMGWALAGGLAEKRLFSWLKLANQYFSRNFTALEARTDTEILGEAFAYLDYALYQRPRFIARWSQTNWHDALTQAVRTFGSSKSPNKSDALWKSPLEITSGQYVNQLQCWLSWRMYMHGYGSENEKAENGLIKEYRFDGDRLNGYVDTPEYAPFVALANRLRDIRLKVIKLLKNIDKQNRVGGLRNAWRRLQLAKDLYDCWQQAHAGIPHITHNKITFAEKWAMDLYVEIALLTVRMLAEGRAYETAKTVAEETSKQFNAWLDQRWIKNKWLSPSNKQPYEFKFTPLVARFQRATLFAWRAYTTLYEWEDYATNARLLAQGKQKPESLEFFLDEIQGHVSSALAIHSKHPLAKFVQAEVFLKRGLYAEAISELLELLSIVAPFDPKRHTANWETGHKGKAGARGEVNQTETETNRRADDIRTTLYYMERVSGQRQFEDILDRSRIHMALADAFLKQNEIGLAIEHLLQAITWSPYNDLDVSNFLKLGKMLHRLNRFEEAFSAIQEVKARHDKISALDFSVARRMEPYILECVINTRLNNHNISQQAGLNIAKNILLHGDEQYSRLLDFSRYRITDVDDEELSEFYSLLETILQGIPNWIDDTIYWSKIEDDYSFTIFADFFVALLDKQNFLHI